jgi:hypothetical protein
VGQLLRRFGPWAAVLLLLGAANGCKDKNNPVTGESPSNVVFPATNVSYGAHVQILFNQACNFSGCHDDGQHQSALKLTTFDNAVRQLPGIVVAGNPDGSVLVLRIQGSVGTRMPPGSNPLNQNQINGIRTWIAEGANNN